MTRPLLRQVNLTDSAIYKSWFDQVSLLQDEDLFDSRNPDQVSQFRGPDMLGSNFTSHSIYGYPTPEHAYQAAKFDAPDERALIWAMSIPGRAKQAGGSRGILNLMQEEEDRLAMVLPRDHRYLDTGRPIGKLRSLRPDWNRSRIDVMRAIVVEKAICHNDVQRWVLSTGRRLLVEGNYWKDRFWGQYQGEGTNWLGRIWMEVRFILSEGIS